MIGLLAFLLPLTLFLGVPSAMWNFDGVACAAALELGQPAYFFHANHLLYGFFGFLFWKWIGAPLGMVRALPALQLFTSLLSAAGLVGLYRLCASILQNRLTALGLTLSLAVTAAFWVWSVEAQVYPLGFLALAWAAFVLFRSSGPQKYVWTGVLHGAAVLGHEMHLLWIVPAVYWMRREADFQRRHLGRYLGSLAAVVLIPYMIVLAFVIAPGRNLAHILIWLKGSAGLTPDRRWAWHSVGWSGPWIWLKSTGPALWGSFWPYGRTPVPGGLWAMTAVSALILLILLFRAVREFHNRAVAFALLWLGTYGLFLSTWEPATLCYRMTDIIPLGILMAVGLKSLKAAAQGVLIGLVLAATLAVNLATRIGPMRRPEENPLYQETLTLSRIAPPDSLYITESGTSWMYLLYFTGRTAWNRHSLDPERLEEAIARQKKIRPVYIQNGSSWDQVR
jgi:cadmium resistance protein CadD (predicted permease)